MEQLKTWMTDEGLTHEQAATRLSVGTPTLRGWLYEHKTPRDLATIQRIAATTKGRVRLEDWSARQQAVKS